MTSILTVSANLQKRRDVLGMAIGDQSEWKDELRMMHVSKFGHGLLTEEFSTTPNGVG